MRSTPISRHSSVLHTFRDKKRSTTTPFSGSEAENCPLSMKDYFDYQRIAQSPFSRSYMLWVSRRIVKEKQHLISGSEAFRSGFFNEHIVNMAFCELSKAIARNLSQ